MLIATGDEASLQLFLSEDVSGTVTGELRHVGGALLKSKGRDVDLTEWDNVESSSSSKQIIFVGPFFLLRPSFFFLVPLLPILPLPELLLSRIL